MPKRHAIDETSLHFLGLLADLGESGSAQRQGWNNLLQVHGFDAVMRAAARCYHLVDDSGKVTNDQAQAVLDGKFPGGHAVALRRAYRRRTQVA
ncbi:MAG: hypothetical protein H0W83_14195 [Planctomycetes bacterium]|nr:hypothetical protein [Planctomycetota bacterium]